MEFRTFRFVAPSGYFYEIREQNGADEDILSNPVDARTLMNLTKFISAIVVKTDFTAKGKLSIEDALALPVNDRYAIIIQSRIFSLGISQFIGVKNLGVMYEDLHNPVILFSTYIKNLLSPIIRWL
ncbi:MAG: hypothetical protein ACLT33_11415 [Lachnospira pectinoschiza]